MCACADHLACACVCMPLSARYAVAYASFPAVPAQRPRRHIRRRLASTASRCKVPCTAHWPPQQLRDSTLMRGTAQTRASAGRVSLSTSCQRRVSACHAGVLLSSERLPLRGLLAAHALQRNHCPPTQCRRLLVRDSKRERCITPSQSHSVTRQSTKGETRTPMPYMTQTKQAL